MKLIVGLGNPGKAYVDSRHNIGFSVINSLAQDYRVKPKMDKGAFSISCAVKISQQNVVLALPLTFMNLSGMAVGALRRKYKIELQELLVVCDDLDLEFGRMKIRPGGSSGGHRGLESIIDCLGSRDFSRLRIGIGRPHKNIDPSDYVLTGFSKKEKAPLEEIVTEAGDCCKSWVRDGVSKAMNIFNRRKGA